MDEFRHMRCPECGRVASVASWCRRPICVHAWEGSAPTPEVWDGDDVDGDGRAIERSPNEKMRAPGAGTWAEMVAVELMAGLS